MKSNQSEGNGQVIRVVDKAFNVLHVLSQAERDMDLATLSEQTGLPKSTLVRLLHTMKLHNAAQQDAKTRRYRLGWGLIHLGKSAERQFDLQRIIHPYLDQLSKQSGETASLAILEGAHAIYLAQVLTDSIIRGVPPIGAELQLHCTAVGKVLLTSFTDEQLDQLISEHGLPQATDKSIVNSEHLRTRSRRSPSVAMPSMTRRQSAAAAASRHRSAATTAA